MFQKVDEIAGFFYRECKKFINKPCLEKLVLASPFIFFVVFYIISSYLSTDKLTDEKDIIQVKKYILQFTAQILLGLAGLSTAFSAWQRVEVSREDQITERYTRAIDQLGSEKIEIRLGGIYGLERIAKDSTKDLESILKILTAFVRENSSVQKIEKSEVDKRYYFLETDVQAVITLLGESNYSTKSVGDTYRFNLVLTNLEGAFLYDLNLTNSLLYRVNLRKSYMVNVDLSGANLRRSDLGEANLRGADLSEADLSEADLSGANLSGANLSEADLRGADLSEAREITPDQIKNAKNWKEAKYSNNIKLQLGLASDLEKQEERTEEQPPSQN